VRPVNTYVHFLQAEPMELSGLSKQIAISSGLRWSQFADKKWDKIWATSSH